MAVTHILIETVSLSSSQAVVTFNSIPQTYTDLVVFSTLRSTSTTSNTTEYDVLGWQFNSSTSGYATRQFIGNGSTPTAETNGTTTVGGVTYGRLTAYGINNSLNTASSFSSLRMYIPNYAGSANKSWLSEYSNESNASARTQEMIAGSWSNTAAITSISFGLVIGSFVQYSSFSLYGIKNS